MGWEGAGWEGKAPSTAEPSIASLPRRCPAAATAGGASPEAGCGLPSRPAEGSEKYL